MKAQTGTSSAERRGDDDDYTAEKVEVACGATDTRRLLSVPHDCKECSFNPPSDGLTSITIGHLSRQCHQRAEARSMTEQQEQSEETGLLPTQDLDHCKDDDAHGHFRFQLIEDLSYEDVKKCYRGSTVSKYNSQYHKLFQCVPKDEILMKVYSCALLRDILLQGRLYISRNWLCFYANLFGKDIKVAIPVVSVRLVKKHKTAGLVPNGLAITTDTGQKYVFVSLLSRDSVYDVLRRICTHLQVNGKSLSLKQFLEEPTLSLDEFPVPDEFPVVDEFPSVLKWRGNPPWRRCRPPFRTSWETPPAA
ncbi:GRAM domain-containing protein 2A-like isoform X4 [Pseudoliparis swirei]|uniref:GRAM domain-containing protein 2A-like isoform X4 n=1 Tax=Pseudoliparis swirei TaxID=2059687 RepID=UPI0024BE8DEC|nr:GRAM domain-containing protein 2A-like isoform X4 [Pseudoliparis swirei]